MAGVDAGAGEDEKRDALGFDLGRVPTAGRVLAPIVEERVGKFFPAPGGGCQAAGMTLGLAPVPELGRALDERAAQDETTASEIKREALRRYLKVT